MLEQREFEILQIPPYHHKNPAKVPHKARQPIKHKKAPMPPKKASGGILWQKDQIRPMSPLLRGSLFERHLPGKEPVLACRFLGRKNILASIPWQKWLKKCPFLSERFLGSLEKVLKSSRGITLSSESINGVHLAELTSFLQASGFAGFGIGFAMAAKQFGQYAMSAELKRLPDVDRPPERFSQRVSKATRKIKDKFLVPFLLLSLNGSMFLAFIAGSLLASSLIITSVVSLVLVASKGVFDNGKTLWAKALLLKSKNDFLDLVKSPAFTGFVVSSLLAIGGIFALLSNPAGAIIIGSGLILAVLNVAVRAYLDFKDSKEKEKEIHAFFGIEKGQKISLQELYSIENAQKAGILDLIDKEKIERVLLSYIPHIRAHLGLKELLFLKKLAQRLAAEPDFTSINLSPSALQDKVTDYLVRATMIEHINLLFAGSIEDKKAAARLLEVRFYDNVLNGGFKDVSIKAHIAVRALCDACQSLSLGKRHLAEVSMESLFEVSLGEDDRHRTLLKRATKTRPATYEKDLMTAFKRHYQLVKHQLIEDSILNGSKEDMYRVLESGNVITHPSALDAPFT